MYFCPYNPRKSQWDTDWGQRLLPARGWRYAATNYADTKMGDYTSFLFAKPSFLEGMARVLDLGGTLTEYNRSRSGSEADETALLSDWLALAEDVRVVSRPNPEMNRESQSSKARN